MVDEITPEWIIRGLGSDGKFSQTNLISAIRNGFKDLRNADLQGADLCGIDLNNADLQGANLSGVNFSRAHLFQTNFSGAILDNIDLEEINLRYAEIETAIFRNTQHTPVWIVQGLDNNGSFSRKRLLQAIRKGFRTLRGANLSKVRLTEVDLNGADLRDINLRKANLRRANLRYSDLREADLFKANLIEADFTGANLQRATLTEADFTRAVFLEADLREARFIMATAQDANLCQAKLTSANLKKANFQNANFENADMGLAHLTRANLVRANLIGANLTGAAIRETQLMETNLEGSHLPGADLTEANLCKAILCGANLRRAILMKANLSFANLSQGNLIMANLIQAILNRTIITGAKLYGSSRDDWNIANVQCDYIFWDSQGECRTPEDRNFQPGEFEKLYKSDKSINEVLQGVGNIKGELFEQVIDKLLRFVFPSTNIERGKKLKREDDGCKEEYEYDFIITDPYQREIIVIETKGYNHGKQIPLGDNDTKETVKWFFGRTFPFAKKVLPNPDNYTIKACYITCANFAEDAIEFLEKQNNTRLKSGTLDVFYDNPKLLALLGQRGLHQEIKALKKYFRR